MQWHLFEEQLIGGQLREYLLYKRTSGTQTFEDGTMISVIPAFISGRHVKYSSFQVNDIMTEVVKYCSRSFNSINCISVM